MKTSRTPTFRHPLLGVLALTLAALLAGAALIGGEQTQAQPATEGDSHAFLPLVLVSRASGTPSPTATNTPPPGPPTGVPLTATPGCGSSLPAPDPVAPSGAIYPAGQRTISWSSVPTASQYNLLVQDKTEGTHNLNVTIPGTTHEYEFRTGHVYSVDVFAISETCHLVSQAAHADVSVPDATPSPTPTATARPTPQPGPHTVSLPCRAWLLSSASSSYTQALAGANINIMPPNTVYGQPNTAGAGQTASTDYYIEGSYLFCDTSSVPANATVQWANLRITNCGGYASVPFTAQWYASTAREPITAADWPGLFQPGVIGSLQSDQCPSGGSATVPLAPASISRGGASVYFVTTNRVQNRSGVAPNTAEFLRFDVANSDALTVHFEVP